jgi:hypothetical protein
MSEFKTIDGFGAVKVEDIESDGQRYVTFDSDHNKGLIKRSPEFYERKTINHKDISILLGYRVSIKLELVNLNPDDYLLFFALYDILNGAHGHGVPIRIYPSYDAESIYNVYYDVKLKSDIGLLQLSTIEAGQTLELEFKSEELIKTLPKMVQTYLPEYLLTEEGAKLLLETGGKIILDK